MKVNPRRLLYGRHNHIWPPFSYTNVQASPQTASSHQSGWLAHPAKLSVAIWRHAATCTACLSVIKQHMIQRIETGTDGTGLPCTSAQLVIEPHVKQLMVTSVVRRRCKSAPRLWRDVIMHQLPGGGRRRTSTLLLGEGDQRQVWSAQ